MNDNQFYEFCRLNKEISIERNAQGQIIIKPLKDTILGKWSAEINGNLGTWNNKFKLGEAFINAGFTLPNGAIYGVNSAWMEKTFCLVLK